MAKSNGVSNAARGRGRPLVADGGDQKAAVLKWPLKKISVELTLEELQAILTLADNQLFRVKYIDPKMPGYVSRPEELRAANSAVQVLQDAVKTAKGIKSKNNG